MPGYDHTQKVLDASVIVKPDKRKTEHNANDFRHTLLKRFKNLEDFFRRRKDANDHCSGTVLGKPRRNIFNDYRKGKHLGQGAFGQVFVVEDVKTGKTYACKKQSISRIKSEGQEQMICREIEIMARLNGDEATIGLIDVYEDKSHIFLVMDLCGNGDLLKNIVKVLKEKGSFTEQDAAKLTRKMLKAVQYCHSKGVLHRDIKPENFLWSSDEKMKLADFGLSSFFEAGTKIISGSCGTPPYMGPELWLNKSYDEKVDVFALGVTICIMLTGDFPFMSNNMSELKKKILDNEFDLNIYPWSILSDGARTFVFKMLATDPDERFSIEEALQNPWVVEGGCAQDENLRDRVKDKITTLINNDSLLAAMARQISKNLSAEQTQDLFHRFSVFDRDGDGKITLEELYSVLGHHVTMSSSATLFDIGDVGGKGYIDFNDFIYLVTRFRTAAVEDYVQLCFNRLDTDQDGKISRDELRTMLENNGDLNQKDIDTLFTTIDVNNDGFITYEEFQYYWNTKISKQKTRFKLLTSDNSKDILSYGS